ncbi:alpha/beta hydrolase [Paenibacillus sp. HN-1]|uniref:alpha/beta fold hydrolase n=1 Tax=Paenibacillus TaxID=44249 RepID=UPI001CA97BEB|nr:MULTISPECIES: alpha/beta hydrolase [Paenibacillus]MBY9079461.1 alpha/beta hydrolase [Paenibacillus sp. CGMCC 1.18879]MBY9083442.1 alpha/beta hydrolase [Paenibacillus sinensis]
MNLHRRVARLKDIDLFYLDTGSKGPAILCLHGRWGRGETWYDFMRRYGERYRIIAPDQRGHGWSGKPVSRYTAEEMADDMVQLLNVLEIDSAIVVGHSMGGQVAGYLAALDPNLVEALAILDKSPAGPAERSRIPLSEIKATDPVTQDWPLPFSSLEQADYYIRKEATTEISYSYFMNSLIETPEGYNMLFSTQSMALGIAYNQDWHHLLPSIECPVLLVRAKDNEAVPDEELSRMQALIPNCRSYTMSHPHHNVYLSNKEEFYTCFDEFLLSI